MTEQLHPGLGSGALREALSSRLLQWRKIHASTKGQWRTNYEEGRDNMLMDCIEGLAADIQKFDSLLSLSSPIEPDSSKALRTQISKYCDEYPDLQLAFAKDRLLAITLVWTAPTPQASSMGKSG